MSFTLFFGFQNCYSQSCDNSKARDEFQQQINDLQNYLSKKDTKPMKIAAIIERLERLTKIFSESDGSFFGKFSPTKNDIKAWETWYDKNFNNICWDKKKKVLYLRK